MPGTDLGPGLTRGTTLTLLPGPAGARSTCSCAHWPQLSLPAKTLGMRETEAAGVRGQDGGARKTGGAGAARSHCGGGGAGTSPDRTSAGTRGLGHYGSKGLCAWCLPLRAPKQRVGGGRGTSRRVQPAGPGRVQHPALPSSASHDSPSRCSTTPGSRQESQASEGGHCVEQI